MGHAGGHHISDLHAMAHLVGLAAEGVNGQGRRHFVGDEGGGITG